MRRRPARGFVLVLVLAMLVVLSLLAGTVAAITARLRDQAQQRQAQVRDEIDIASTRASVLYLLTTQAMTIGGLTVDNRVAAERAQREQFGEEYGFSALPIGNEIALDGRAYRGLGDVRFALQDDRGLFGINQPSLPALQRLLAQMPGSQPLPAAVLFDRLMDYQDEDDLHRLNSLEKDGYQDAGLPPPSNLPLVTPLEVLRIPGWAQALGRIDSARLNDTLSVTYNSLLNVNTAPAQILRTLPGVDVGISERIIARRKLQPFLTDAEFYGFTGLAYQPESGVSMYPSASGTLKFWSARGGQVRLLHWTLTPVEDKARPWREDYEFIHSQSRPVDEPALPVASRLFAKPVAAPH